MTPYSWPATLPCFRFEPYSLKPRPGATQVDVGPITARARVYAENNDAVSVEVIATSAQEIIFRNFWRSTLGMGTQTFLAPIFVNAALENREALFTGTPVYQPVAPGYVRITFFLLTWPAQVDPPPPVLDYDAIVLARNPDGYWRFDQASPATTFPDLSGHGRDILYTGSRLTYENPTLNLDGGLSLGRDHIESNWFFGVDVTSEMDANPSMSLTVGGWLKFNQENPSGANTLFHLGGSSGGGQTYKLWVFRNTDGHPVFGYHHNEDGLLFHAVTATSIFLELNVPLWYECGIDFPGGHFFFKKNGGSVEYFPWTYSPNGIEVGRGPAWFQVGRRSFEFAGDAIDGQFSHNELYLNRVVSLGMWPDWHL